jgi:acyl-CoA reductase-like NAD-dependent aldehyde dehydrogenase
MAHRPHNKLTVISSTQLPLPCLGYCSMYVMSCYNSRIVNTNHTQRLAAALASVPASDIVIGGQVDVKDRWIAPTVLKNVSPDSAVMKDEIFGPILPVLSVPSTKDAISFVTSRDKPLALYVFANDQAVIDRVLRETSSGGVSVNDCVMQVYSNASSSVCMLMLMMGVCQIDGVPRFTIWWCGSIRYGYL